MTEWILHADATAMADRLADEVAQALEAAVEARGEALAAVPGGRTPGPALDRLAQRPLPWPRITLFPTDERQVATDHPLSNLGALQGHFAGTAVRLVPLADAATLSWPPDLVWLGMGGDGHVASLFPGPDLEKGLAGPERVVAVHPQPLPAEAPVDRLTLSGPALVAAPLMLVAIRGAEKRRLLEVALEEGGESRYPVGRLLAHATHPVLIHWCPE